MQKDVKITIARKGWMQNFHCDKKEYGNMML